MTTADNQQERLQFSWWLVGFTDGEGCFSIGIIKNKTTKHGYQVFPEFVITQGAKSKHALDLIQQFFQCGKIYINNRYDNHREPIYRYCVRTLTDLSKIIIPFFSEHTLETSKIHDFQNFQKVVNMMIGGKHLTLEGFQEIQLLKSQMNRKILRDYTSDSEISEKI